MRKLVILLSILSLPATSLAKDPLLSDAALMKEAKSVYNLDKETELRCAALGLDNVRKIALYRLISRRIEGDLQEVKDTDRTKSPALERLKVSQPNSTTKELKNQLELFAQPELVKFIEGMSDVVYDHLAQPLQVTGTTVNSSKNKDEHCTHAHGLSVDFRPMPGVKPTTWKDADYDRAVNKAVIEFLIAAPEVRRIFFNDPDIFNDPKVKQLLAKRRQTDPNFDYRPLTYSYQTPAGEQKTVQHDNHVHVELKGDDGIWHRTNEVYKHLSGAKQ